MKIRHLLMLSALVLGACDKKDAPPEPAAVSEAEPAKTDPATKEEPVKAESAKAEPAKAEPAKAEPAKVEPAKAEPAAEPAKAEPVADDVPRVADFPDVALAAEVGQAVFAPSRASLDEAKKNPKYRSPRYWQATVTEVGPATSKVKATVGQPAAIPNAYMIPIPKAEAVAVGDVVLSSQYGNDMSLAVVTEAGDAPKAEFVESMPYDKVYNAALKPGRYLKLDGTLKPGAPVALKEGSSRSFATVVSVAGDKLFLAGFMGKVKVATKADVVPLELTPDVKKGDEVMARWSSGTFKKAKVISIYADQFNVGVEWVDMPTDDVAIVPLAHVTKKSLE